MTTSAEPPFRRIGIAGLGLIGGSIALAARTAWPRAVLVGFDPHTAVSRTAHRGVVHEIVADLQGLAACDLIVLAMPLPTIATALASVAATGTTAVVTDVGSTKRDIVAAARAAGLAVFVGGHPMAGSERAGLAQARADMFEGRPWLLVRDRAGDEVCQRLEAFVAALGAVPQWIDADAHDRTVAYISHLPQVIAVALMNAASGAVGGRGLTAAGRAFQEMTRLASSPPDMWAAVFARNDDFVVEAITRFVAELPSRERLVDARWVQDTFERADRARTRADGGLAVER